MADKNYLRFKAVETTDIAFNINGTLTNIPILYYSLDKTTWTQYVFGTNISLNIGDKCYWKGDNNSFSESNWIYIGFSSTGKVYANGNIMSLLDSTCESLTIPTNSCFRKLFYDSKILSCPELPATTLANNCYQSMFSGCNLLTTPPKLPAMTLVSDCYSYMFNNCASLEVAPDLQATTLAENCYYGMFSYSGLIETPKLPAMTLANECYREMFNNCKSLVKVNELPATTLANYCYYSMFMECTSLTMIPDVLPAIVMKESCYSWMFYGCTSLRKMPNILATTLAINCFRVMFGECSSIKISSSKTGNYQKPYRIPKTGTISSQPSGWNTQMFIGTGGTYTSNPSVNTTYYVVPDYLCFEAVENTTIKFSVVGTLTSTPVLYYSTNDGSTWNKYTFENDISLNAGDKCYWKGDNNSFSESTSKYIRFISDKDIICEDNVMSLLDSTCQSLTIPCNYCFYMLFRQSGLLTCPLLPATTLTQGCYFYMFRNNTHLATVPTLPATVLKQACYLGMFSFCYKIKSPMELPSTSLASQCYEEMFNGCRDLISIPELPATTLAIRCYKMMFNGCSKIKLSETQTKNYPIPYRIPSSGTGTTGIDSLLDMFSSNETFTGTPSINTTYYLYQSSKKEGLYIDNKKIGKVILNNKEYKIYNGNNLIYG